MSGSVTTFAGNRNQSTVDGTKDNASFHNPTGIAMNELTGDIYVVENAGNVIRKISPQGTYQSNVHFYSYFYNIKDKSLQLQEMENVDFVMDKG